MSIEIIETKELRKRSLVEIERQLCKAKGVRMSGSDVDLFSYPVRESADPEGVEIERFSLEFNIRFTNLGDAIDAYDKLNDAGLPLGLDAGIVLGRDLDCPPYIDICGSDSIYSTRHVSCSINKLSDCSEDVRRFMDAAGVRHEFQAFDAIKKDHLIPVGDKWRDAECFGSRREAVTGGGNVYSESILSEGSCILLSFFSETFNISEFLSKLTYEYDYAYLNVNLGSLGSSGLWERRGSVYEIINSFDFDEIIMETFGKPDLKSVSEIMETEHQSERGERRMFGYSIRGIGKGSISLEYQGGKGRFLFHMEKESSGRSYGKLIEFVNSLSPSGDIVDLEPI